MTSITSEFERHPTSSHRRPFRLLATRHRRKRWPREPPTASREQILVSSWPEFPILGTITCKFQLPVPPSLAASHPPASNQGPAAAHQEIHFLTCLASQSEMQIQTVLSKHWAVQ